MYRRWLYIIYRKKKVQTPLYISSTPKRIFTSFEYGGQGNYHTRTQIEGDRYVPDTVPSFVTEEYGASGNIKVILFVLGLVVVNVRLADYSIFFTQMQKLVEILQFFGFQISVF